MVRRFNQTVSSQPAEREKEAQVPNGERRNPIKWGLYRIPSGSADRYKHQEKKESERNKADVLPPLYNDSDLEPSEVINSDRNLPDEDLDYHLKTGFRFKKWFKHNKLAWSSFFITVFVLLITGASILVLFLQFQGKESADASVEPTAIPVNSDISVAAVIKVENMEVDGEPCHIFLINSQNGTMATILNKSVLLDDGYAEIAFKDNDLYSISGDTADSKELDVNVEVTADKLTTYTETIKITIDKPTAYLDVQLPASTDSTSAEASSRIVLDVKTDATVTINGEDYTGSLVNGHLELDVDLPSITNVFVIKVSSEGYADTEKTYTITRDSGGLILDVHADMPVEAITDTLSLTGAVTPGATLTSDPEADITVDNATGDFTVNFQLEYEGYNLIKLTAEKDGAVVEKEVLALLPVDEDAYSRNAWSVQYDLMAADPTYLNGQHFVMSGKAQNVQQIANGVTFELVLKDGSGTVWVAYYGDKEITDGSTYKVFANRWGVNGDDIAFYAPLIV